MKKHSLKSILSRLSTLVPMLALVACLSSCDNVIYNYEEDCDPDKEKPGNPGPDNPGPDNPGPDNPGPDDPDPETVYYVEYIFEKNMQFVDGFNSRVHSVDLYVFNSSNTLVATYHEEGAPLTQKGYRMELTDLPAGTYNLIAWCGLTNNNYFSVYSSVVHTHDTMVDMVVESDAKGEYSASNLTDLFHGMSETPAVYTDAPGEQVYTIYLTKDTNTVNITLQHKSYLEFTKNRFKITMRDNNTKMRYNNEPYGDEIEYRPYYTELGRVTTAKSSLSRADANATTGNYLRAELSMARLMTDHNPTITVVDTEQADKVIFSIPLINWALQLRDSNHKGLEDQDYLDREDHFNLMLWLDSYDEEGNDEGWFGAGIEILEWHVIDDGQDLQ